MLLDVDCLYVCMYCRLLFRMILARKRERESDAFLYLKLEGKENV